MIRGTTPTLEFTLPFNWGDIDAIDIVFAQCRKVILKKTMDDCTIVDDVLKLKLTKADTLKFQCGREAEIQLIVAFVSGDEIASEIITVNVEHILWDGEIR